MDKSKFKFKLHFNSAYRIEKGAEFGKFLSKANLNQLRDLMPAGIDLDNNPDITGIVLNAANGNYCNKNGDAITNETLVKIAKNFVIKRVDIEHIATKNVGVIVNYGFSEFETNKLLTEEEVLASKNPVNLSLALILWDTSISDELYDLIINSANPNSLEYNAISASWELYYNDFDICMGKSKNVSECKILAGSEKQNMEKYLPKDGGIGKLNGNYLFRLIKNDENNILLPAGIGLVENPAAEVKGLQIIKNNMKTQANIELEIENEDSEEKDMKCESCGEKMSKDDSGKMVCAKCGPKMTASIITSEELIKSLSNIDYTLKESNTSLNKLLSTIEAKSVIDNKNDKKEELLISKDMTIKSFKELTDESLKVITAADLQKAHEQFVADSIKEASEKYEAALKENKVLADKQKESELALAETKAKLNEISNKLQEIESKEVARLAEANFNARMDDLDKNFELTDDSRAVIAKEVKSLASNEDFDSYKNKMTIFLKKKEAKVATASTATVETVVTEAVKTAETKVEIPNAGQINEDYKSLVAKAFGKDNITISIK